MKTTRLMKYIVTMPFIFILVWPLIMIIQKLVIYMDEQPFQEWWITLMWLFIAPLTLLVLALWKYEKEE